MFSVFRDIHESTGVDHAIEANFTSSVETNLIIARATILQVWAIDQTTAKKLEMLAEWNLHGKIESISKLCFPNEAKDCLLLAFGPGRVSVVEFDFSRNDLVTRSLHNFEREHLLTEQDSRYRPRVATDSGHCCWAACVYSRELYITSVAPPPSLTMRDEDMEDVAQTFSVNLSEVTQGTTARVTLLSDPIADSHGGADASLFTADGSSLFGDVYRVQDMVFLQGYYEPTLALLHDEQPTTTTRLASRANTKRLTALGLSANTLSTADTADATVGMIWNVEGLPHNSFAILPVSMPYGGVIVVSPNAVIYCNQNTSFGISLNAFSGPEEGRPYVLENFEDTTPGGAVPLSLDCARLTSLTSDTTLITARSGDIYVLTLIADGTTPYALSLQPVGSSVQCSCVCTLGDGHIFLGSRLGDSLLLRYGRRSSHAAEKETATANTAQMASLLTDMPVPLGADESTDLAEAPADLAEAERQRAQQRLEEEQQLDLEMLEVFGQEHRNGAEEGDVEMGDGMEDDTDTLDGADAAMVSERREMIAAAEEAILFADTTHHGTDRDALTTEAGSLYWFAVCDSLVNIGPIANVTIGELIVDKLSLPARAETQRLRELAMCSGYGKNGAICVLTESIVPEVMFEIPCGDKGWGSCCGVFAVECADAVVSEEQTEEAAGGQTVPEHSYMFLSFVEAESEESSTVVLRTGEEIEQVSGEEGVDFVTDSATLLAANIGPNSQHLVQVLMTSVRIYRGTRLVCELKMQDIDQTSADTPPEIKRAATHGSFIVLITTDGALVSLRFDAFDVDRPRIVVLARLMPRTSGDALAVALYHSSHTDTVRAETVQRQTVKVNGDAMDVSEVDEEELALYGQTTATAEPEPAQRSEPAQSSTHTVTWCVVGRANGSLEVWSLPDMTLHFSSSGFVQGEGVIVNMLLHESSEEGGEDVDTDVAFESLAVVNLGRSGSACPCLFAALSNHTVLVYQTFYPPSDPSHHPLARVRFSRLRHSLLPNRMVRTSDETANGTDRPESFSTDAPILAFKHIGGQEGVFVGGERPHLAFASKGALRLHPFDMDGPIQCFAEFHNTNCKLGLAYMSKSGVLKLCQMREGTIYNSHWPLRKIPLFATPRFICYDPETKSYLGVVSKPCPAEIPEEITVPERAPPLETEQYEVRLISHEVTDVYHSLTLDQDEVVTCCRVVSLQPGKRQGTANRRVIAVGTSRITHEEKSVHGRILLYDIRPPMGTEDKPTLKELVTLERKAPVTQIESVCGYLIAAIGPKLEMYSWELDKLTPAAFYDHKFYVVSMNTLKNFVLIGDAYCSIQFLRWREDIKNLELLGKDFSNVMVQSTQFAVDHRTLSLLYTDIHSNLVMLTYDKKAMESLGGQRLVRRAAVHIGSQVTQMCRIPVIENVQAGSGVRMANHYTTADGGVGCLFPVDELMYRRLLMVQTVLTVTMHHHAGLHPRTFRDPALHELNPNGWHPTQKPVLDGNVLFQFFFLSAPRQREVSRQIGLTPLQIANTLLEIDRRTRVF